MAVDVSLSHGIDAAQCAVRKQKGHRSVSRTAMMHFKFGRCSSLILHFRPTYICDFLPQKIGTFSLVMGKTSEVSFSTSFKFWSKILKKSHRFIEFPRSEEH